MKKLFLLIAVAFTITACQESLEDQCVREAKEYTQRCCPTPVINNTRTDSVTFDKDSHTYQYFCTFIGALDNEQAINQHKQILRKFLIKEIKNNTSINKLKEAQFNFRYIIHSARNPQKVLYEQVIQNKEYQGI